MPHTFNAPTRALALAFSFFAATIPTIKPANAQISLKPTADTYVLAGKYDAVSYGTLSTLNIERVTDTAVAAKNACAYIQFDFTNVKTAYHATLTLTVNPASTPAGKLSPISLYDVGNPSWTEASLNWNNAPGLTQATFGSTGTLIGTQNALLAPSTATWDVTSFVVAHLGSKGTIQIVDPNIDGHLTEFCSRETGVTGPVISIINAQSPAPTFSPAGGSYSGPQTVTIKNGNPSAVYRYTTDGTTPNDTSAVYFGPITIGATQTVQAIATLRGTADSAPATAAYTITPAASQTFVAQLYGSQETPGDDSNALGTASLVVNPGGKSATLSLQFSGLAGAETSAHIQGAGAPGTGGAPVLYDMSTPFGGFSGKTWTFAPVGGLTVAQILSDLQSGLLYANVESAAYPGGEIRGQFYPVSSMPITTRAPAPRPDSPDDADAVRFLEQSTFGPTLSDVALVKQIGLRAYLAQQFAATPSNYAGCPNTGSDPKNRGGSYMSEYAKARFFDNAVHGPDQLRQRVAWALSQVLVTSLDDNAVGYKQGDAFSSYMGTLNNDAIGNYRTLLQDITLTPYMGHYLDMIGNMQANAKKNTAPNENFGREVMQLFTIGTLSENLDGTFVLDNTGAPIPTYDNDTVTANARALTGWVSSDWPGPGSSTWNWETADYLDPMVPYEAGHDLGSKSLVNAVTLPANQTAETDLGSALDALFNHPNIAPYISRILIQHLVTANPSPGYVARVASVFNNDGTGVHGNLEAVVSAILLDGEAGENGPLTNAAYGHLREPAQFVIGTLRALNGSAGGWGLSTYTKNSGQDVFCPSSVFSYYQPDNTTSYGDMVFYDPERQLMSLAAQMTRMNYVNTLVYGAFSFAPTAYTLQPTDLIPTVNFSNYDAYANDPATLVYQLNALFLHGTMSPDMQQTIINAVNVIPASTPHARVQQALYLVLSSMQYQVEL